MSPPITLAELICSINNCKLNKAPGPDEISNEFFKFLPDNWLLYILPMFNKIVIEKKIPNDWAKINIKMIHKKGDKKNPDNYRPISLLNSSLKIFTQILLNRLTKWISENDLLPEWQSGFRKSRSCMDNIFVLNSAIQIKLCRPGGRLYALFVDFRKAFDSLNHNLLWKKLDKQKIDSNFILIMKNIYNSAEGSISLSQESTPYVKITKGVLQGEILSPILFALFLADLEDFLKSKDIRGISITHKHEILLLAYADDIVLLAENVVMMNRILKALAEYCKLNSLNTNTEKTEIIIFKKGGYNNKNVRFKYGENDIKIVKSYTYLGVKFSQTGLFNDAMDTITSKAHMAIPSTISLIYKLKADSWSCYNKLFDSLVKSILTYGAPLWSIRFLSEVEKVQTTFFKRLYALPNNTPHYAIRLETGRVQLALQIFKATLNYLIKILAMHEDRYPLICLKKLIEIDKKGNSPCKYNWVTQVKEYFFIKKEINLFNLTVEDLRQKYQSILKTYEEWLINQDLIKLRSSSSLTILPHLNLIQGTQLYLQERLPLKLARVIIQTRLLNEICPRIIFNSVSHKIEKNEHCYYCNELNNFIHIIFSCKYQYEQRKRFLQDINCLEYTTDASIILGLLNEKNSKKFACFIIDCIKSKSK